MSNSRSSLSNPELDRVRPQHTKSVFGPESVILARSEGCGRGRGQGQHWEDDP